MAAALVVCTTVSAGQDFSQSTITFAPRTPVEGDLVTMTLNLRNTGKESALHAEMEATLPVAAMFVDADGLDGAVADLQARTVTWTGQLDPGATRRAVVRLILPFDAGGDMLASTMQVRYLFKGVASRTSAEAEIGSRPAATGLSIGGVRIRAAEGVLLGLIAGGMILYVIVRAFARRRQEPFAAVLAVVIATGFWTIFASMAWHDWRVLRAYRESRCTILDSRVRFETTSSGPAGGRSSTTARTTTTAAPLLALRYQTNEAERVSTGFGTQSDLQIGGAARVAAAMNGWATGTVVPCWYDPVDPQQVVVRRGFGGAYLFALFPLPLFLFGIWRVRGVLRGKSAR